MNAEETGLLRIAILRQLNRTRLATPMQTLLWSLKTVAFNPTTPDLERELQHLINKGWIVLERFEHSFGVACYRITAAGTEYLETQGY